MEALKQIQQYPVQQTQQRGSNAGLIMQPGSYQAQPPTQMSPDQNGYVHTGDMFSGSDGNMFGEGPGATTPSSLMAELTSWGEFDSLVSDLVNIFHELFTNHHVKVTAGIGGLDFMFMGDQGQARWDNFTGQPLP